MKKFSVKDINAIERCPSSPAWMKNKFSEILFNSTNCRCKVENVNPTTGEYRVILYGTFDWCGEDYPTGNPA